MMPMTLVRRSGGPLTVADLSRLLENARASGALDDDVVLGVSRTSRLRLRLSTLTVHISARDGRGIVLKA